MKTITVDTSPVTKREAAAKILCTVGLVVQAAELLEGPQRGAKLNSKEYVTLTRHLSIAPFSGSSVHAWMGHLVFTMLALPQLQAAQRPRAGKPTPLPIRRALQGLKGAIEALQEAKRATLMRSIAEVDEAALLLGDGGDITRDCLGLAQQAANLGNRRLLRESITASLGNAKALPERARKTLENLEAYARLDAELGANNIVSTPMCIALLLWVYDYRSDLLLRIPPKIRPAKLSLMTKSPFVVRSTLGATLKRAIRDAEDAEVERERARAVRKMLLEPLEDQRQKGATTVFDMTELATQLEGLLRDRAK